MNKLVVLKQSTYHIFISPRLVSYIPTFNISTLWLISISNGQAACLLWFSASLFKITMQHYFQREHRKQHPAHKSMVPWHASFIATQCTVCHHSSQCPTSVSKATIKYVEKFMRGPRRLTRHVCKPTPADPSINDVAHCHKKLIKSYRLQSLQAMSTRDKTR